MVFAWILLFFALRKTVISVSSQELYCAFFFLHEYLNHSHGKRLNCTDYHSCALFGTLTILSYPLKIKASFLFFFSWLSQCLKNRKWHSIYTD